jgi:site-specific DNA-methyltransferase (adenine-specific)
MKPFYKDDQITLYCGDMREIVPALSLTADAIITDPPYGETALEWDRWPEGWPKVAATVAPQMWCFGSMRMFLDRIADLSEWKLAQDVVWEKHNGSGFATDRFKRVHEFALHFYRGEWAALHKAPPKVEGEKRFYSRKAAPPHTGAIGGQAPEWHDERIMRSVIPVRSCHGYATNETQKPEGIVRPLMQYSVPPGGTVVDFFAGSGTMLAVARELGLRAIGIEKRESQCRDIVERLSQGCLQLAATIGR